LIFGLAKILAIQVDDQTGGTALFNPAGIPAKGLLRGKQRGFTTSPYNGRGVFSDQPPGIGGQRGQKHTD
jgi:hypothetical protein